MTTKDFGQVFKRERERQGLSQKEIAIKIFGKPEFQSKISAFENGKTLSLKNICKYICALGRTIELLPF